MQSFHIGFRRKVWWSKQRWTVWLRAQAKMRFVSQYFTNLQLPLSDMKRAHRELFRLGGETQATQHEDEKACCVQHWLLMLPIHLLNKANQNYPATFILYIKNDIINIMLWIQLFTMLKMWEALFMLIWTTCVTNTWMGAKQINPTSGRFRPCFTHCPDADEGSFKRWLAFPLEHTEYLCT